MAQTVAKARSIISDPIYKLGAVGLATVLWFFSISTSQFEADVELPIEIRNLREGKALSEDTPRTAVLRFRGTGRALAKLFLLLPSDSKLVLDLVRVRQRQTFYLDEYIKQNPQRIRIPIKDVMQSIEFIEVVEPDTVLIILGDYKEKRARVIPQISVIPAPGYTQVGGIKITPSSVLVQGVVEAVDAVESVRTMRSTYADLKENLNFTIGLLHPDPAKMLDVLPVLVTVDIDIQAIGERRFSEVPVRVINVPKSLNVFVSPSMLGITIIGGTDYLGALDPASIEIIIDYATQWSPTVQYVTPQVRLDSLMIDFKDVIPPQVEIITTRLIP